MGWKRVDSDFEIAEEVERKEIPFQLLSFPVLVDNFPAVLHFPNHWQKYEPWQEILPPKDEDPPLDNLNERLRAVLDAGPTCSRSSSLIPRVLPIDNRRDRPELEFDVDTQRRLSGDCGGWLNTSAVQNTARLLQFRIQDFSGVQHQIAQECAILPCEIIPAIERNSTDDTIWRICNRSRWWAAHFWLVPIHRNDHWVLGALNHEEAEIWFYDSFGPKNGEARRMEEMRILHCLMRRLDAIARAKRSWTRVKCCPYRARLLMRECVQIHNYTDCGVWVISVIVAILFSYASHTVSQKGTHDNSIHAIRKTLVKFVQQIE